MNVKELIEKLNKFDQDLEVMVYDDEWGFSILNDIEISEAEMELVEYPPYKNQPSSRSWCIETPYNINVVDRQRFVRLGF
jgi:hypothetical protein